MSGMDDRQNAEETKFQLDQELEFKANARRNKLLGLWAAERLGLAGEEAEAYAKGVVLSDFEAAGDEDVFAKVKADLEAKGAGVSDEALRARMGELLGEARAQVKAQG